MKIESYENLDFKNFNQSPWTAVKPKRSICSLAKWADTAFWLYTAELQGGRDPAGLNDFLLRLS